MTSVLDGLAGTGGDAIDPPAPAPAVAASPVAPRGYSHGVCPECRVTFQRVHPRQLFCSPVHKAEFHNRATVRGRMLTPIAMAARITRDGSRGDQAVGKDARRDSRHLMDLWVREDREAGRLSTVEYMRERRRIGY